MLIWNSMGDDVDKTPNRWGQILDIPETSEGTVLSHESIVRALAKVTPTPHLGNALTIDEKIEKIAFHFSEIMKALGLDLQDDSLKETPKRVARMYVKELFQGLTENSVPKITAIENKMEYDQMVLVKGIRVMSMCEHHMLPIHGTATVAYIPNKKVVGLSKLNRIVDYFCRRPQVQERLTKQIADFLQAILETEHVAIHIEAKHYCMIARGVEDQTSSTITNDLRGHFKSLPQTRQEFLASVSHHI